MTEQAARLINGYYAILKTVIRLAGTLFLLVAVSVAISMPLWLLATYAPRLFDMFVIGTFTAILGVSIVRRLRGHAYTAGNRRMAAYWFTATALIAVGVITLIGGRLVPSIPLIVIGSGMCAWRSVPG